MAKLSEIEGIGEAYSAKLEKAGIVSLADLLECAGVDTVPELAQRNPENLLSKMSDINGEKNLARKLPTVSQVRDWVAQVKKLPRVVTY
jgi:predicted flap endonuclease-1-like 5' DNA nuclease